MKEKFEKLVNTHKKLRKDCPWDKEQDFDSLKKIVIEEASKLQCLVKPIPIDAEHRGITALQN